MIDAKELRIGNWLMLGKNFTRVYQIIFTIGKGNSINHVDYIEDWFEPIPLTTEILFKCGFHKYNNAWVPENYDVNNYNHWYFTIWDVFEGTELKYNSAEFQVELKYLHQLQNLYYALTQKELEINLQP